KGVGEKLKLVGMLSKEHVYATLKNAKALVMLSRLETFGIPFYEAMVNRCPILAADRDFAREACQDAALYFDPDDESDIVDNVDKILSDQGCAEQLVKNGAEIIDKLKGVSWDQVLSEMRN
ncbi:glycosyltransferase, partial [Candidatus Auribacterota bacterium]